MKKCWVSAYLYVQGEGGYEGTIGGIASFCDDPNTSNKSILIEDCLFSGRSAQGRHCGSLMSHVHGSDGYNNSAAFTNCLNLGTCDNPSGSTGTFARKDVQGDPYTITNCYYKTAWQYAQGTQATTEQLSDGTTATALQNGRAEEIWVQDPVLHTPMLKLFANDDSSTPTAINNTATNTNVTKRIVNGQLLIEKNGKFYNATGIEVK